MRYVQITSIIHIAHDDDKLPRRFRFAACAATENRSNQPTDRHTDRHTDRDTERDRECVCERDLGGRLVGPFGRPVSHTLTNQKGVPRSLTNSGDSSQERKIDPL